MPVSQGPTSSLGPLSEPPVAGSEPAGHCTVA